MGAPRWPVLATAVMGELGGGAASLVWGPEVVGMVMARVVELGCALRSLK